MSIKSYKQYIDRCEVVSFDVFDTLIKRNVRTPKDVFSLVKGPAAHQEPAGQGGRPEEAPEPVGRHDGHVRDGQRV